MNIPNANYFLAMFAAALMTWAIAYVIEHSKNDDMTIADGGAEYFSIGYQKIDMDETGRPKNDLLADSMIHMSQDGTTHLANPVMTLYNAKAVPWVIHSKKGILSENGEDLMLAGQVNIKREGARGIKPLVINTSNLAVKLPTNYAETVEWAEIISSQNKTEGVGMQATFVEPIHLHFLADVKGRYEIE